MLSALSCPLPGIWCQLCHGTSGFHCLTSAYIAPFKCGCGKASPTGKALALYNSFHPTDKHLCWVFDYIALHVSPSYCLRSSFTQLHRKTSKKQLTTQKGKEVKYTQTPLPRLSEDSSLAVASLQ